MKKMNKNIFIVTEKEVMEILFYLKGLYRIRKTSKNQIKQMIYDEERAQLLEYIDEIEWELKYAEV